MPNEFADVLVGAVKNFDKRISTLESSDKNQKLRLQKLEKDVEEIQSNMNLVIQYMNSTVKR